MIVQNWSMIQTESVAWKRTTPTMHIRTLGNHVA